MALLLGVGGAVAAGCGVASADTDADTASPAQAAPDSDSPKADSPKPAKKTSPDRKSKSSSQADADTVTLADIVTSSAGRTPVRQAVTNLVDGLLDPAEKDAPANPPASLLLAAATAKKDSDLTALPDEPDVDLTDGVIGGCVVSGCPTSDGLPLHYVVVDGPDRGGKTTVTATDGQFSYLPDISVLNSGASEQFVVLVSEDTPFVAEVRSRPVLGLLADPVLTRLYQAPILSTVLSPLIGDAELHTVSVDVGDEVPPGTPVAFTEMVISFDGTNISTNFFPASGLLPGQDAPTILNGPSLATAGYINPDQATTVFGLVPGLQPLRAAGYNVVTWDPRGEYASGGVLELDKPNYEGRDVQAIITWLTRSPQTRTSIEYDPGDVTRTNPLLGMVGGSYGGGIQLATAGIDDRIDAISPGIAWHTLPDSLYPNEAFRTSWATILLLSLVTSGSRINPQIYSGIFTGAVLGVLTPRQLEFLNGSTPDVAEIDIPTLFLQGTVDVLFPLQQAVDNAEGINPNAPVKMVWYCGGHGICLDPGVDQTTQTAVLQNEIIGWMNTYVKNKGLGPPPPVTGPKFTWIDQNGDYYSSDVMPYDPTFQGDPLAATSDGGTLVLTPFFGSGPQWQVKNPLALALGAKADYAINVPITIPEDPDLTQVVGAPELTFDYRGLGTSRHVYAQIVDNETGRVLGNIVSPIPVTLDGQRHTMTVPVSMENIAYSEDPSGKGLTLQIVGSATAFENFTSYGVINIDNVKVALPTVGNGVAIPGVPA